MSKHKQLEIPTMESTKQSKTVHLKPSTIKRFRIAAAMQNCTVKQLLEQAIEEYEKHCLNSIEI